MMHATQTEIFTVNEGRVIEIRHEGKTIKVLPPVSISKYPHHALMAYLEVYADLNKTVQVPPKVEVAPPCIGEVIKESIIGSDSPQIPTPTFEKTSITPPNRKGALVEVIPSFEIPKDLPAKEGLVSRVPKALVDVFITTLTNSTEPIITDKLLKACSAQLRNNGEGYSKDSRWRSMVHALEYFGYVNKMGVKRGTKYTLDYNSLNFLHNLKTYYKRRNIVTVDEVAEAFWIPEHVAREKIEWAVEKGLLEKHPRKDEYKYMIGSGPTEKETHEGGYRQRHVVLDKVKYPHYSTFEFRKIKNICMACAHNYGHAYVSGQTRICGGCYEKLGGVTAHGQGATITNAKE